MLSERQLQGLLARMQTRMQGVTDRYLAIMGEHLRTLGGLKPSDVHRLTELRRAGANVRTIQQALAREAGLSIPDLTAALRTVAASDQEFADQWFGKGPRVKGAPGASTALERVIKAQLRVTAQAFSNLSQTTIQAKTYREAVDVAIQAVQTGVTDYASAIRGALRKAGRAGLRVQYPSGLTRRLDSAVRQNVLDGVRSLNNDILRQIGNEYGADGVEISAHALCATDHLPYQGRQFSHDDFAQLQAGLPRPFGRWNCKHTMYPIILGVSEPAHTPEELASYARNSGELIEIDGRSKTRYEWTQEQRRIETAIRQQKDVANLAKAAGDDVLRREAQAHINDLQGRYARISAGAGLAQQPQRAAVAGFRRVKTAAELKKPAKRGILSTSTEAGGGDVQFLCRIDRRIYSCVTEDITTDEVVITNERIEHIKDHHPKDYEQYLTYIKQILQEPDYILENEPNTALVLKEFKEDDRRFRLVLRLKTSTDNPGHKNSVLTFMKTNEKKWGQNLRNKKILYKRGS